MKEKGRADRNERQENVWARRTHRTSKERQMKEKGREDRNERQERAWPSRTHWNMKRKENESKKARGQK